MNVEQTLADFHKQVASVTGEVAGVLARRKFQRSAVVDWRKRVLEAVKLLDKLDGG